MRRWLPLVQAMALAAVLMCPTPGGLGARVIGSADGDAAKHVWTLWWMRHELLEGEPGLLTRMVNFADGVALYPIDPLDGLVALLLPLRPIDLANLLAFLHLTLLGLCAAWLGRLVSGSRLGGFVAGALAQGSAFTAFTLHVGVGELRQVWWVPLGLACLVKAHETGRWRWFVALGAAGAGATLACFYHGAFLALSVAAWLGVAWPRSARALAGYALALAIAAGPAAFAAQSFASTLRAPADVAALEDPATGSVAPDAAGAAAALDDLYLPRAWVRERLPADERAYTGGRYLGLLALGLAIAGIAAAPRRAAPWAAVAVVGVVLSLGSIPHLGDRAMASVAGPWGAPFAWLNAVLARIAVPVNFPARFLAMTMVAIPVLASLATRWRKSALLVPLAIIEIQAADLVPWPRETLAFPPVRGLSGKGAILDLGVVLDDSRASRLLNISVQMLLSSPTQAVPIDRLDHWNNTGARWARALPLTQALRQHAPAGPDAVRVYRADLALLQDKGFERILLTHPSDGIDAQADGLLTALCGPPQRSELATLWTLPPVKANPEELDGWRAAQALRVEAVAADELPGTYPTSPAIK